MPILKDNPTQQEIFDMAASAVIIQGKKSAEEGICQYTSDDGSHCAVGHLLTEKKLKDIGEKGNVHSLIFNCKDKLPSWFLDNEYLLCKIQNAHDTAMSDDFINDFKDKMNLVAEAFQLSTSILDKKVTLKTPVFDVMSWMSDILESTKELDSQDDEGTNNIILDYISSDL